MSNKYIYSFTINKKVKKEVTEEQGDTKITKTIEVDEPVKVVLKRPNREEWKNVEFEYGKEFAKCVRAGILTKPFVVKMYSKDGFLDDQKDRALALADELNKLQLDFQELSLKEDKTEDDQNHIHEINLAWNQKRSELANIEVSLEGIFENTADSKAEQHAITYLTIFQTYLEEGDALKPAFRGDTFEAKLKHYDALAESENEFMQDLVRKSTHLLALWYLGKAVTEADFNAVLESEKEYLKEPEPPEQVEAKVVEPEPEEEKETNPLEAAVNS